MINDPVQFIPVISFCFALSIKNGNLKPAHTMGADWDATTTKIRRSTICTLALKVVHLLNQNRNEVQCTM